MHQANICHKDLLPKNIMLKLEKTIWLNSCFKDSSFNPKVNDVFIIDFEIEFYTGCKYSKEFKFEKMENDSKLYFQKQYKKFEKFSNGYSPNIQIEFDHNSNLNYLGKWDLFIFNFLEKLPTIE